MTHRPDLTLCVINFNGEAYLEDTLRAAVERASHFLEILLIDNASTDGSVNLARRLFPAVRIVPLAENRGPSAARNRAWREAVTDRLLVLDNDVVLHGKCVEILSEALDANSRAVAAMPSVIYAADPEKVQYDGAGCHYLGLMTLHNQEANRAEQDRAVRKIDSLVTACFLADRSRWGGGDPFDENLFIYFEDHDFGMRIRIGGGEILSVPEAACLHREGTEGLSLRRTGRYTGRRVENVIRNRWQIVARNYSARSLLLLAPALLVYELSQLAAAAAKGWLRPWASSARWMAANRGALLRKRRAIQRGRAAPDRDFLRGDPIPFTGHLAKTPLERAAKGALDAFVRFYWALVRRAL